MNGTTGTLLILVGTLVLWTWHVPAIQAQAGPVTIEGQVVNGPMEIPGGEFVLQGVDPQGAMFSLIGKRGE